MVIMGPPVDPDADNHQGIPGDQVREVLEVMRASGLDSLPDDCGIEALNGAIRKAAALCGIEQGPPPADKYDEWARRMAIMHPEHREAWCRLADRYRMAEHDLGNC
jgi:hypothetical protein